MTVSIFDPLEAPDDAATGYQCAYCGCTHYTPCELGAGAACGWMSAPTIPSGAYVCREAVLGIVAGSGAEASE